MYKGKYYKDLTKEELIEALETMASIIKTREFDEKSFEDGYAVAKRLYQPITVRVVSESELDIYNITKQKHK